jgi:tetratricopeptide (TPR) repeat protein
LAIVLSGGLTTGGARAATCPRPAELVSEEAVEKAKAEFGEGISRFNDGDCEEAIAHFLTAIELWPAVDEDAVVTVPGGLPRQRYLPFLFLGYCHDRLNRAPDSFEPFKYLRLEGCRGFAQEDDKWGEDFEELVHDCGSRVRQLDSKQAVSLFKNGVVAYDRRRWQKAAEAMWQASQIREEDGTSIEVGKLGEGGRWGSKYLPRFFLGASLANISCYSEARAQLDRTLLATGGVGGVPMEQAELEKLRGRLSRAAAGGGRDRRCWEWCCWLGPGS